MANPYNEAIIKEFRENAGKTFGAHKGQDLLLLHSNGAKSGEARINPLAYTMDGDKFVIVASKGGAPTNPGWYYNLRANPEVEIEVGTEKFGVKAHETDPAERDRLYEAHATRYPGFWDYKKKTAREIPVFTLERS